MPRNKANVLNSLREARTRAGMTQTQLSAEAGISRQAYSALESGNANPSTEVSLRLARALGVGVESLFYLAEQPVDSLEAELVGNTNLDQASDGQPKRTRLFRVRQRLLARPLAGLGNAHHAVVAAEGLITSQTGGRRVTVQPFEQDEIETPTLAMLGCDPAVGLLESGLRSRGITLVSSEQSSRQALVDLANGDAHVAGCHLLDEDTGTYNGAWVRRLVPFPCTLVTFAAWQQGLITARGNPWGLQHISDLSEPGIRLANRQSGSGSRALLDRRLANAGIPGDALLGYDREETGHLAVAAAIASGSADVGVGVKAAAAALGLDFIPLEEERYDLVIPNHFLNEGPVQVLLDLLRREPLHRRVESLGGYDVSGMGVPASVN
ncbi:MAG: helix-turn-helix domain-containing protein [SAR202 cluster bacterium]|nr:helix-turn-helix domain-containing protein [SAR202 cluster bacterium]